MEDVERRKYKKRKEVGEEEDSWEENIKSGKEDEEDGEEERQVRERQVKR